MTDVEALALGLAAYAGVFLIIALITHSRRCSDSVNLFL